MEENNLAYPKKIDINSFPKEKKRKKKKKRWRVFRNTLYEFKQIQLEKKESDSHHRKSFFFRIKRRYKHWKAEQRWKKAQKRRRIPLWERFIIFLLSPIADYVEDRKYNKEQRKILELDKQPNIFLRLYWIIKENREESKERKALNKNIRETMSFDLEQDKTIFSLRDEWINMKEVWKSLPWDKSREFENSIVTTIAITLAFSFNYLLIQVSKFLMASFFHIPTLWKNGRIIFNIPDASPLWTYNSVIVIYIIGPIVVFSSAMIFMYFHNISKDKSSLKSLIFLWTYLTAFLLFFGTYIAGMFTDRGFGYVLGWLFIPKYIEIPLGIFFIFMLWMIGYSSGKKIIMFTPAQQFQSSALTQFYFKLVYLYLPILLSIITLLLIGFNNRDFTIQLVFILFIGMMTPTLRFIHR